MKLKCLVDELNSFLQVSDFQDYCPNGLQVEGKSDVNVIVSGVTASESLIDAAIAYNADAILVHHGYFWRGEPAQVTGIKKTRLKKLLSHDISLLAYHLPLDAHPEVGNNVQLARVLNLSITSYLDDKKLLPVVELAEPILLSDFVAHVSKSLGRNALLIGDDSKKIKTLAWCTGAAQSYMINAIEAGVDLYLSGEVSEQTYHLARESGTAYLSAGHHATERYGVQALGAWLARNFEIDHCYVELNNPI